MNYLSRAHNLFLFILALVSIAYFGRRKSLPISPPRRVLIVQLSKLGDMVCVTPMFRALRQHLPGTKIYVLGDAINKELLKDNPDIDEYLIFKESKLFSIIRQLKSERIDVACIRGTGFVGLVAVLFAGIPTVIAPRVITGKALETRTYAKLLPYVYTVDFKFGEYMPRQFLRLLEPLGIFSDDTRKHLGFSKAADKKIKQFFIDKGVDTERDFVVGISPSAGNKIKEWPEERFAEVADYLIEKHQAKIVLIGGHEDDKKVQKVIKNVKNFESIINTQGKFNIDELKAFISKINLFISVDTGPIYIAEAFNIPTIDIVGPMDEREQSPIGKFHKVVVPKREKSELHILNAREYNEKEALRQTLSITTSFVLQEVERLLHELRGKERI